MSEKAKINLEYYKLLESNYAQLKEKIEEKRSEIEAKYEQSKSRHKADHSEIRAL